MFLTSVVFSVLVVVSAYAQGNQNPPYPRIFMYHFGAAPVDWYQRFDMVLTSNRSMVTAIKEVDPSILTFAMRDWNVWDKDGSCPSEWYLRRPDGEVFRASYGKMVDISNFCPPSSARGGLKYNEYLIDYTVDHAEGSRFDGYFSQGVWEYPYNPTTPAVDLDRNGVDDYSEHGKSWIRGRWLKGVEVAVSEIYDRLKAQNKMLILNSGRFHKWEWSHSNGLLLEHLWVRNLLFEDYFIKEIDRWTAKAPEPRALLVDSKSGGKNDFENMRYMLCFSMLGDGYYSFTDTKSKEHYYTKFYDEFEIDLGYPKSGYKKLSNACYVRFFDNGVFIMNPTGAEQSVSDGHLAAYSEYDGPYFRFLGGQDPAHNDGSQFTQISLPGEFAGYGNAGDGILLTTNPATAITDIIIDDNDAGTSPVSERAAFTGYWNPNGDEGDDFYSLCFKPWAGFYKYAYTMPGQGDVKAVYKPTIGVAGNYEVFEWHGTLASMPASTSTPFVITFTGGNRSTGMIDQSRDAGKWNSLGTYYFEAGESGNVTITDKGNGTIIADAFKFVFKGRETDTLEPNSPQGVEADILERKILLAWSPPAPALDGDRAAAYQVFRDRVLVGTPREAEYHDEDLEEDTPYFYEIYAVDEAGNRSVVALDADLRTISDTFPPQVVSVLAHSLTTVVVQFSEKIDPVSGESIHNYTVGQTPGVTVLRADLLEDSKSVRLTTTDHVAGASYTLRVENVKDRAKAPNSIIGVENPYIGVSGLIEIAISADNAYELYVNGQLVGSNEDWAVAESYAVPSIAGKNVVAVKGIDLGGEAGLVAEIDFEGEHIVTSENWKISVPEQTGWNTVAYNDASWNKATSWGKHGVAEPWSRYNNVANISTENDVEWIWSSDQSGDDIVYFRYTLRTGGDTIPPNPPTGVVVNKF